MYSGSDHPVDPTWQAVRQGMPVPPKMKTLHELMNLSNVQVWRKG